MRIAALVLFSVAAFAQEIPECREYPRLFDAYFACLRETDSVESCKPIAQRESDSRAACDREIVAEMKANTARIAGDAVGLNAITERINALNTCRQSRRWWQFWKRCKY